MTVRSNSPYIPSYLRAATRDARPVQATYADFDLSDSSRANTGSFKYDPLDYPLKSTQQLNVDWSKFENHCFFSSAEVKVNEAFNKIINSYPFDGTKKEVEEYMDDLTGFEKYVLDSFPQWSGALHFSGTQVGEDPSNGFLEGLGTWIPVKDKSGNLYPDLSKNNTGEVVINPGEDQSLTLEMLLYVPEQSNDVQVVCQKSSGPYDGFTLYLSSSASSTTVPAVFSVTSGSVNNHVAQELKKGSYNHICVTLNKEMREHTLQFYLNEELKVESKSSVKFLRLDADNSDLLIGSGSAFYSEGGIVTPMQTLSGTMDEFRVFHAVRTVKAQKLNLSRGIYSTPDLKLYYRFNEPSGSYSQGKGYSVDSIVLDSSGNSLHSNVQNYDFSLRVDAGSDPKSLMYQEKKEFKTVLFPSYQSVLDLNTTLLAAAKDYDSANPNNIIKLIPQHYLLEGAAEDGFQNPEGRGGEPYGGIGIPGQGERGPVQIILSFLYIWAKFFDEMKTFIDSFGTLKTVSYDTNDTIPDNFLEDMIRSYGLYLPKFFNHSTVEQFAEGQNVEGLTDIDTPLKRIQSILTRRVLINMNDIVRSKGTQHSIRSFLRSVGIDPDNSLRIREYGGSTTRQITTSRERRFEPGAMVFFTTSSLVVTPPLSASRVEPGYPHPVGSFVVDPVSKRRIGTTSSSDGLLTSGSWTVECVFKFPPQALAEGVGRQQSLFRLVTTGSSLGSDPALVANIVATQSSSFPHVRPKITAYFRPGMATTSPIMSMSIDMSGSGLFDSDKWNVSFGCFRNDEISSVVSSSYFLRAGKSDAGDDTALFFTSSYFEEQPSGEGNVLRSGSSGYNASGSYICIGKGQTIDEGIGYRFLNDTLNVDEAARITDFGGWASNLRFWSKGTTLSEWKEHVRNPKSVGVSDPLVNYNYTRNVSGSFAKLRLDTLQKQPQKYADNSGELKFLDFSMNTSETSGSGYLSGSRVLVGDLFSYTYLSPTFDEASTSDKVRIRSYNSADLRADDPWAVPTPSYLSNDLFLQEEPRDDLRLSIEFSMMDSLDKDIVSMFSSFDVIGDIIGSPEMMFSPDYPGLDRLRDVYFNRLSGKPDFRKFLEFYRWFDASISSFIEQLLPSKTLFKGTNYVIESHMLERHKNMYRHSSNYLGTRETIDDSLLTQQIVGKLRKY